MGLQLRLLAWLDRLAGSSAAVCTVPRTDATDCCVWPLSNEVINENKIASTQAGFGSIDVCRENDHGNSKAPCHVLRLVLLEG